MAFIIPISLRDINILFYKRFYLGLAFLVRERERQVYVSHLGVEGGI